jgi:multiple sugar transport system substrate-binding protein
LLRPKERSVSRPRLMLASVAAVALAALVASCSSSTSTTGQNGTASQPITLTYWSWDTFAPTLAQMYEKTHPNVTIKVVNAGQGLAEYTKLRTAILAHTGVPDIIDMEFPEMRTFETTNSLLDLSNYGANSVASKFIPWVWGQVSSNGHVYGIPLATGQMGLLYRKDILAKYGIAVPATYAQFATAAAKLHAADPSAYLTNFAPTDYNAFMGLIWQAGAKPFAQTGQTSWDINLTSAPIQKVANYWAGLIANGSVAADADYTTDWYQGMSSGKYASWLVAAWGPYFLTSVAANTSGLWRAASLPQWIAGADVSGNEGGGATVGYAGTKYPAAVTSFLEYTVLNPSAATFLAQKQFRFPVTHAEASDPAFLSEKVPFYGGQQVNAVFAQIANGVDKSFQWAPFNDYVASAFADTVSKAFAGKQTNLLPALQAWQAAVVSYAEKQGFTVSTGG